MTSWDDLAKNAEFCDLILRASDDFEPLGRVDKPRFRFSMMGYLRRYETAYFQHKIGVLKDGDWAGISADMDAIFPLPGVRAVWPLIKNRSNVEFRAYIDALIERTPAQAA